MESYKVSKLLFQILFHLLLLFSVEIIFFSSLQKYGKSFILLVVLLSLHFRVEFDFLNTSVHNCCDTPLIKEKW